MKKDLDEVEFTVFDTETTGLEPESGDRIIEIAGIRLKGNRRIDVFHTLINPNRAISEAAYAVNGITQGMLKDAPPINEVLPNFLSFIKGTCLASYNAPFDIKFLNHELKLNGQKLSAEMVTVDILTMAKRLLPNLERYALSFVAERLGIGTSQIHRALLDAELALAVFNKLRSILKTKGVFDTLSFLSLFGVNSGFLENVFNQKTAEIQEALDLGVRLKIKYLSRRDAQITEREIIPKEIKEEKNRKYLVGYCCLRKEDRTFRIDGILHLEIV